MFLKLETKYFVGKIVMCIHCMIMFFQTDLSFGREYTAAIEAKQVGESATTDSDNKLY